MFTYLWTFQEVLKTTPASKLAVKAVTVRNSKPSTKKTVTSKKDTKMVVRNSNPRNTKEKKESGFCSFMARDGPGALGSKKSLR